MKINRGKYYLELSGDFRDYFTWQRRIAIYALEEIENQLKTVRPGVDACVNDVELQHPVFNKFELPPLFEKTNLMLARAGWFHGLRERYEARLQFLRCVQEGDSPQIEEFYQEFIKSGVDHEKAHIAFVREMMCGTIEPEEEPKSAPKVRRKRATQLPNSQSH